MRAAVGDGRRQPRHGRSQCRAHQPDGGAARSGSASAGVQRRRVGHARSQSGLQRSLQARWAPNPSPSPGGCRKSPTASQRPGGGAVALAVRAPASSGDAVAMRARKPAYNGARTLVGPPTPALPRRGRTPDNGRSDRRIGSPAARRAAFATAARRGREEGRRMANIESRPNAVRLSLFPNDVDGLRFLASASVFPSGGPVGRGSPERWA